MALSNEIIKDVFIKARGIEFGERSFSLIDWLCKMSKTARKEGLLSLEEAAKDVPPEIGLYKEIQWINSLVVDGTDPEKVRDEAIDRYWMGNFQGEDAWMYYMIALGFLMIQAGVRDDSMRRELLMHLPQDAIEQYEDYQSRKLVPIRAAQKEKLFHDAPVLEGDPWTLKKLLEEKILQADDKMMQHALRDIEYVAWWLTTALKGLSPTARQKILSNISEKVVDNIAADWEYSNGFSCNDLAEALGSMLRKFEDAQKELAEE